MGSPSSSSSSRSPIWVKIDAKRVKQVTANCTSNSAFFLFFVMTMVRAAASRIADGGKALMVDLTLDVALDSSSAIAACPASCQLEALTKDDARSVGEICFGVNIIIALRAEGLEPVDPAAGVAVEEVVDRSSASSRTVVTVDLGFDLRFLRLDLGAPNGSFLSNNLERRLCSRMGLLSLAQSSPEYPLGTATNISPLKILADILPVLPEEAIQFSGSNRPAVS
mmetsp:Transcript_23772/g.34055  ORF Transcript_23772/g.34055 Transcript_23772/m.34055 type:complete len:224 (+) Transcript_23772:505-1176(+)